MANIPSIPGVSPIQAQSVGVKINPGPTLQRIGAGRDAINAAGQSISQISDSIVDYEKRKQKAEEAYFFNKSAIVLNKTTGEFARKLRGMDDQQIVPTWDGVAQQTSEALVNDPDYAKMSAPAKQQFQMHLANWQAQSTGGFQMDADVRGSTRRWGTALAASNELIGADPNNITRAAAPLKMAKADAPIGALDKALRALPAAGQIHSIISGSETNAPKTLKAIESGQFGKLNPTQYKEWHAFLKGAASEYYATNTQNLYGKADPKTGIIPEQEISMAMNAGLIQKKAGENLLASQKRQTFKEDDDNRKGLMYRVGNPDEWKSDPKGAQADFIAEAGTIKNPDIRNRAVAEINRVADSVQKTGETGERPIISRTMEKLRNDPLAPGAKETNQLTAKFDGSYVMTDADVKRRYGKSRDEVVRGMQMQQAHQADEMMQWFKDPANKDATYEQAEAARENIVMGQQLAKARTQAVAPDPVGLAKMQDNLKAGRPWYQGSAQMIRVKNKDGQPGTIPASNLKKALAAGYTIAE